MFPILKKAIQLKKEEERIERPFRRRWSERSCVIFGLSEDGCDKGSH
jgi:hypothetical protein